MAAVAAGRRCRSYRSRRAADRGKGPREAAFLGHFDSAAAPLMVSRGGRPMQNAGIKSSAYSVSATLVAICYGALFENRRRSDINDPQRRALCEPRLRRWDQRQAIKINATQPMPS